MLTKQDRMSEQVKNKKLYLQYLIRFIENRGDINESILIFEESFDKGKFVKRIKKYIKLNLNTISKRKINDLSRLINKGVKYNLNKADYKRLMLNNKLKKIKRIGSTDANKTR